MDLPDDVECTCDMRRTLKLTGHEAYCAVMRQGPRVLWRLTEKDRKVLKALHIDAEDGAGATAT